MQTVMEPGELTEKYRVWANIFSGAKLRKMLTLAKHFQFSSTHVITQM